MMRAAPRGFSIVELLIAMTLGLVLSAGIIQVFLANRQAQRVEQSVARLQENGRIALDLITEDLRMAGFLGCGGAPTISAGRSFYNHVGLTAPGALFDGVDSPWKFAGRSVRGFTFSGGAWAPGLPSQGITAAAVAGARDNSDVLAVYGANQSDAAINGAVTGGATITVDRLSQANSCFTQNQLVLVSSCSDTELIKVTNTPDCSNANQLTLQHAGFDLKKSYDNAGIADDSVMRPRVLSFYSHAYFVGRSGRTRADGTDVMSLFRWDGTRATELVEGIEFLRVEFGQTIKNSSNIRYLTPAQAAADPTGITSVRVGVLAQSFDLVRDANDTSNYTLAGKTLLAAEHSGSRILRQAYTTTVELRNSHRAVEE